ncbi:MAG: ParB/RepB/Spo0J family partition protein [Vicinamibacteria bacterium]
MTTATATATARKVEFKQIPIGDLKEAPYNPRTTFNEEALKELAESIRAKGVLSPLLVRPVNGHWEIVGGSRRYRAARKAGLKDLPCQVRDLSDDEALEVAVIDNLQRTDVAPLEEARGYQELLRRGHKIEDLAKRISKSVRYIYARIELQKLSAPVQKALDEGKITASHAQEIATLDADEDQKKALDAAFVETYDEGIEGAIVNPKRDGSNDDVKALMSVRDFKKTVSALKIGTELVEKVEALKLANHKAHLVTEDYWYANKQVLSHGKWKRQGGKACKFPAKGVLVSDKGRGQVLDICTTTSCKKHFATHPVGTSGVGKSAEQLQKERQAEERRQQAELVKRELERRIKVEAFRQVCDKVRELPRLAIDMMVADALSNCGQPDYLEAIKPGITSARTNQSQTRVVASLKPIQLAQLAIGALCEDDINGHRWAARRIADFAKDLGVNLKALEKGIRGKFETEAREKKAAAEKAKKGGARGKK